MNATIRIKKYAGELEEFSEEKLRMSLENAGAKAEVVDLVVKEIKPTLYDGMSSSLIYKNAHKTLRKKEYINASKYRLKKSIQELGPTGYPFEIFVGELFKAKGYEVNTGIILSGKHVMHEVDVLAESPQKVISIECKFHNKPGYKSDVKVPLYVNSRVNDLKDAWKKLGKYQGKQIQGGLVTNSRFTKDAVDYGQGEGLLMMSWDFPLHDSLRKRINEHLLYPITSLQSLTKRDKKLLIEEGLIVTKSLCENFDLLEKLNYPQSKIQKIIYEANLICEI